VTKREALKLIPQHKKLLKEEKVLEKLFIKTKKRLLQIEKILDYVDSAEIINRVPVKIKHLWGGLRIEPAHDECNRYGFVEPVSGSTKYQVNLGNKDNEDDNIVIKSGLTKKEAISMAVQFIDKGIR
jgi:hypothetical protein